jgi:hypothetical protein
VFASDLMVKALIDDCWSKPWNLTFGTYDKKLIYPLHTEVSLRSTVKAGTSTLIKINSGHESQGQQSDIQL